jgi:hypothetical protein
MAKTTADQMANSLAEEVLQESEEVEEMQVVEKRTVRSQVVEVVEEVQDAEDAAVEAVSEVEVEEKADRNGCMEGVVRRPYLIHHRDHGVGSVVADDFLCYLDSVPGVSRTWHRVSSCSK